MIANSNNPQKRAESIGALAWICGGGVILGASLIIAGIIINVATNNSGTLLGRNDAIETAHSRESFLFYKNGFLDGMGFLLNAVRYM